MKVGDKFLFLLYIYMYVCMHKIQPRVINVMGFSHGMITGFNYVSFIVHAVITTAVA